MTDPQINEIISRYRPVFAAARVPETAVQIAFGSLPLPLRDTELPFDTYGFVPALLPLWAGRGPKLTGYWKHWFGTRQTTVVEVTVENNRRTREVARTQAQLSSEIVLLAMGDEGGMTEAIRVFGGQTGLSPRDVEQIGQIWSEWGGEREGLLELPPFSADPPLVCLDGEGDYSRYTGDFPWDGMTLDAPTLRSLCTFEVSREQLPRLAALPFAPPWFPAALQQPVSETVSPQEAVFDDCLAQKDYLGAWMSLNSSGWTFLSAKDALHRLAQESGAAGLDLLASAWAAVPHEKNGRTPQLASY